MPAGVESTPERALALALRHLNRRERTIHEIRQHLAGRGIEAAVISDTVTMLLEQGLLDDVRYARLFAEDKRELEAWGSERIERALRERGLDHEAIAAARSHEHAESELERALGVLRRRCPQPPADRRAHERALAILLRKGYGRELALEALRAYSGDTVDVEL